MQTDNDDSDTLVNSIYIKMSELATQAVYDMLANTSASQQCIQTYSVCGRPKCVALGTVATNRVEAVFKIQTRAQLV
jgi:hypothetical protein